MPATRTASWNGGAIALGARPVPHRSRGHPRQPADREREPARGAGGRSSARQSRRAGPGARTSAASRAEHGRCGHPHGRLDALGRGLPGPARGRLRFRAVGTGARRRLVLARDPLGMRPLHYHRRRILLRPLRACPRGFMRCPTYPMRRTRSARRSSWRCCPNTARGLSLPAWRRWRPAMSSRVTANGLQARRHWIPQRQTLRLKSSGEYAEALRHHLDTAVRARLRGATERVAAHLSAGFDSSIVATSAARTLEADGPERSSPSPPCRGRDMTDRSPEAGSATRGRWRRRPPRLTTISSMFPSPPPGVSPLDNLERNFRLYDRPVLNLCNATWSDAIFDAARGRGLSVSAHRAVRQYDDQL